MSRVARTFIVVLGMAVLWAGTVRADESAGSADAEEELFALEDELDAQVTTASRSAEPIRTAPASITVIDRRELDAFGYATVAEALNGVRGLYLTDDRLYTSLGVRGFNRFGDYGNRLQVQVDGHVMNDDWVFSSYLGNDFVTDIEHVQQIEIVRGPGSALYGTGAFFGVVNVTTPARPPPHRVRVGATLLDFGTVRGHADGGGLLPGGGSYWLSGGVSARPDGDLFQPDYVGTPWAPDGVARGVDAFSTGSAMGRIFWGDFTLQGSFHQRNRRMPTATFGTVFGDRRNMANDQRGFLELRWAPRILDDVKLLSRVYVDEQRYEGHYTYTDPSYSPSHETFEAVWTGAEVRADWTPLPEVHVVGGGEGQLHPLNHWFAKNEPDPDPYLDQSVVFSYLSAYALGDWTPLSWVRLHAGARFDGWIFGVPEGQPPEPPGFLWSLNPRMALILLLSDDDIVKLMLGRSYRVPSIYEFATAPDGFTFQTDRPLRPETIYTGELEYRRALPWNGQALATVYVNHVADLLDSVATEDEVEAFVNSDVPLWTVGVEGELRRVTRDGMIAAVQTSWQTTRAGTPFIGEPIANSPETTAAAWLLLPLSPDAGTSLAWANRVVVDMGRRDRDGARTDPMVLLDTTLSGRFASVRWAAGVRNLLDWRYEHPTSDRLRGPRMAQDGRTVRFDITTSF